MMMTTISNYILSIFLWWTGILLWITIYSILILLLILLLFIIYHRIQCYQCRRYHNDPNNNHIVIGFFHPYCSSGGGGERVLWKMIQIIYDSIIINQHQQVNNTIDKKKNSKKTITIVVYTVDPISNDYKINLLKHVHERFNVFIQSDNNLVVQLKFVHLYEYKYLLEPASTFSLFIESIGSMRLAYIGLYASLQHTILHLKSHHDKNMNDDIIVVGKRKKNDDNDDDDVNVSNNIVSYPIDSYSTTMLNHYDTTTTNNHYILPDIFIDTTGCSFTYIPSYILFNCLVIAYVHYPTISIDMLQLVWERRRTYNNNIDQSIIRTYIKLIYYILYSIIYGIIGSICCHYALVNSTWTYNHIKSLWKFNSNIRIVYPPCNVQDLLENSSQQQKQVVEDRLPGAIVSIGQFRPEKDHALQLEAIKVLFELYPQYNTNTNTNNKETLINVQLIMIGSCRGKADEERLYELQKLAKQYHIENHVQFIVNQPYSIIQDWLCTKGTIGIHTMWNEHFGIGIVEMMAGGLITIAHNSGGPQTDIIHHEHTGYLATTATEYANIIHTILSMPISMKHEMIINAQESSKRFSDEVFDQSIEKLLIELNIIS